MPAPVFPVPDPQEGQPIRYRCKWTDCLLELTGEIRPPRLGEHYVYASPDIGTCASFDFSSPQPILQHVGSPTAKCHERRQKAGLPPLSPPATADAKEAEPSLREMVRAAFEEGVRVGVEEGLYLSSPAQCGKPKDPTALDILWEESDACDALNKAGQ